MIDGFDTKGLIFVFILYGGVTALGLRRAIRYPSSGQVTAWMADHGLDPGARSRPSVARYLGRTRWIRTTGFLVGFNVPFVWMWVTRSAYRMNDGFDYWWLIGFAAGILLAEIVRPRPAGSATVLEARRLPQYLPDFTRMDPWILAGVAVLPAVGSGLLPLTSETTIPRENFTWYLGLSLAAVAIIVLTRVVQGWIVRRRQSFNDLDDMRADDAMRSASIQGLAGLAYGAPMWLSATMVWDLAGTSEAPVTWILAALSLLLMCGALGMLIGFPRMDAKWTVPRASGA